MPVRKASIFAILLLALAAAPLAAEGSALALSPEAQASAGASYGINVFSGILTGALVGASAEAIPYAQSRHNQDPKPVVIGAVIGSAAAALGVGVPISAYEVSRQRPGAGGTLMADIFGFGVLGGVLGAGVGTVSYRDKVGTRQQDQAEDFLAAGGAGVCAGAVVGLAAGILDAFMPQAKAEPHPPGNGLHARLGLFPETAALPGSAWVRLRLLDADF
jgi:hypothetical protein